MGPKASAGKPGNRDEGARRARNGTAGRCAWRSWRAVIQLLSLSLLAPSRYWRTYITKRRLPAAARGAREFGCLIAPAFVVASGADGVQPRARFGLFTDFGANYNLTVNDMTKRGWNVGRLAPALFAFPAAAERDGRVPYLQPAPFDTTAMGQTIKEVTFGGISRACRCWEAAVPRAASPSCASPALHPHQNAGVIIVLLLGGVIVALVDARRWLASCNGTSPTSASCSAAVVPLVFIVNENLKRVPPRRTCLAKVLLVLVAALAVQHAAAAVPETGLQLTHRAYRNIIEAAVLESNGAFASHPYPALLPSVLIREKEVHGIHHRRQHRGYEPPGGRPHRIVRRGRSSCVLGLATGTTPIGPYACLLTIARAGRDQLRADVTTFNLDEYRGLDPEHDRATATMKKHLSDQVDIDQARTHVPEGSNPDAEAVCAAYEQAIEEAGGIDLQLLGLGPNGHIGFNEPEDTFPKATHCVDLTESTSRRTAACSTASRTCRARRTRWASAPSWPRAACSWWWRLPQSGIVKQAFFGP